METKVIKTEQQWADELYRLYIESRERPYKQTMCMSCRAVHAEKGSCAIPLAPLYVCSNDRFMSGWGHARGMINVCVVPVASMNEANAVVRYIESRSDQNRIRIVAGRPRARGRKLSLIMEWRNNALNLKD